MRGVIVRRIGRIVWVLVLTAATATWFGCKTQEEIGERERRPLNAQAENEQSSMRIIRKDRYPWHNVTFVVAGRYKYKMELCDQPEIEIPYDQFKNAEGEAFDPAEQDPSPLRIYADEGRWPHWGAHN